MNIKEYLDEFGGFMHEGSAVVHVEVEKGEAKIGIGGHTPAIFKCIRLAIDELAEKCGISSADVFEAIAEMYEDED